MRKHLLALPLALAFGLSLAAPAFAVDEVNVSTGATVPGPGLAVHGHDVVAYFTDGAPTLGSAEFSAVYEDATYRFASQENLDTFEADPAKYVPAYGGFCAYGVAVGKKFDGDPRFWKVVDGRLYLNLNGDIQAKWSEDIPGNIVEAEANWAEIRTVAVEDL
ncbi:MAG TPA: YHS domain-containing (seleno)protein [Geminicoccaceae bacterium]|nr:YHS domain-containing (seleno)protein [Geminicoccaceae bacterium]